MTMMMVLFILVGGLIGGKSGMTIAFIFALVMNFGSYWFSDKIVLKMYRAQEVTEEQYLQLFNSVENLAMSANMPMPKVYIMENFFEPRFDDLGDMMARDLITFLRVEFRERDRFFLADLSGDGVTVLALHCFSHID